MRSITLAISKGGVGKTLLLTSIGAVLASKGSKVVIVDTAATMHIAKLLNVDRYNIKTLLNHVVEMDLNIESCVYPTIVENLYLVPSGVPLKDFLDLNPFRLVEKLGTVDCDFLFVDVPYAIVGEAALISLGFCQYYILGPLDQTQGMGLCIEEALNTMELAALLRTTPLGFIINKIKEPDQITKKYIKELEDLFQIRCLSTIPYIKEVEEAYKKGNIVPPMEHLDNAFIKQIIKVADALKKKPEEPAKSDPIEFMKKFIYQKK